MTPELLYDIRNYLDITWEDSDTDTKITGIINRGMAYLNKRTGADLDFAEEADARALLFDYCRYAWSNALEDFKVNFLSEIIDLQLNESVKNYETTEV